MQWKWKACCREFQAGMSALRVFLLYLLCRGVGEVLEAGRTLHTPHATVPARRVIAGSISISV